MKTIFYTVRCSDCEQEIFEGTKLEIENNLADNYLDWSNADDGEVECVCDDCARLLNY